MNSTLPSLSIPDPLRGSELGSFAHDTVVRRLPRIVRQTLEENDFPGRVVKSLQTLIAEIPNDPIRPLVDPEAPDEEAWQLYIQPHLGFNWLEVPWFFAEFYLYRRVLEATRYFQSKEQGYLRDPYVRQKQRGLESAKGAMEPLAAFVNKWVAAQDRTPKVLIHVLRIDLWGNKVDLSLWPAAEGDQAQLTLVEDDQEQIVLYDSRTVAEYLCSLKPGAARVDLLLDNAGFELVTDLCLTDYLLSTGLVHSVDLHPKACPVFVSDALMKDVEDALVFMERQSSQEIKSVVKRIRNDLQQKRLIIQNDSFWTFPLALWEMPENLRSDLGDSDLVISKGDAHYRRLLGDRHWLPTTPFADIMSYLSSPILALRACKSEVICGLEPGQAEALQEKDPGWMTNGQWGLIQFKR
ncbi:MAG: hypothetical protein A2Z14_10250 [Chloroflexi bacterium RBG_16_48_8]|nr:MAG: hypothetical protein A2Z14_10250 [Chloroflexi bacterium RBG_16_48_8]